MSDELCHVCPSCDGKGKTGPVHINNGDAPHEWRDHLPCWTCNGVGMLSSDAYDAVQLGKELRAIRHEREETIMEASYRLRMTPAELSGLERGKGGMAAWHHPFATRAYLEVTERHPKNNGSAA